MKNTELILPAELQKVEQFTAAILGIDPDKDEVKINKLANNSSYLPISFVENKLDEIFFGAWQLKEFRYQVVANEVIGSLQLCIFHPILQIWIERTGCAAVMIQQVSKDKGGSGDITDIRDKIKNTLEKDFPHLKAECLKNAARSLGKIFGRDLNRKEIDSYNPITTDFTAFASLEDGLKHKLSNCKNNDELGMLWESLEVDNQNNSLIKRLFTQRKIELKNGI
jgi:hypothetical protein